MLTTPGIPQDRGPEQLRDWGRKAGEFISLLATSGIERTQLDLSDVALGREDLSPLTAGLIRGIGGTERLDAVEVELVSDLEAEEQFAAVLGEQLTVEGSVELAIELTNARANQLTPIAFAELARKVATQHGLGFRLTDAAGLRAGQFGGITAIGQGSSEPPVLVELWYSGTDQPGDTPPRGAVAIAGKGVTFDSGGLSIKPATGMYSMHTDCAGAATALAALAAAADLGANVPIHIALPLAENMPGPHAVRPGDVVTLRDGSGLEIVDTDFEGRVLLADAVALLAEPEPRALLSLATLTYQIVVALGPEIAGLFARDEALASRTLAAVATVGEPLWQMPWATRYAAQLRSTAPGAALRNHPLADSGRAITAALFIGEFAPQEVPFAHIDFAGPTVRSTPNGPAATGYGVRTLVELLRNWE